MLRILLGLILFVFTADAAIQTASALDPIVQEVETNPQGTSVLLDIGGALITPPDAIFHSAHESWRKQ